MPQEGSSASSFDQEEPSTPEEDEEMKRATKRRRSSSPLPARRSSLFRTPSPRLITRAAESFSIRDTQTDSDVELVSVKREPDEDDSQNETSKSSLRRQKERQDKDKGKAVMLELSSDTEEDVKPDIKPNVVLLAEQEKAILPPAGTPRRKKADRILAAVPDCHPAYVLRLLNDSTIGEDVDQIVAELETADYPLATGSWKLGGVRPLFVAEGSQGQTVEVDCQSCFDKVKPSAAVRCMNGHPFCSDCTLTAAENALGMKRGTVPCFAMNSGCTETLDTGDLKRVFPANLSCQLEVVQTENELDLAGLQGLQKCPFCPFAAIIDDREVLFRCERSGCRKVSCRICGKEDHGARPCNGTRFDGLAGQHAVEEAMSAAVIRKCVQCGLAYIKTDGCNKITCFACGTRQCYICEKRVSAASHWSEDRNWQSSGKCPANDDTALRAYREAEAAKQHTTAALARSGATPLPAASTASLGPSRPERSGEDARRFRNGRHVFRGQDASLDDRPDWMSSGNGESSSSPSSSNRRLPSGRRRAALPITSTARNLSGDTPTSSVDSWTRRSNADGRYANDLDAPGYGLKKAGNGVFGGGGYGGGRGGGSWSGGRGTRRDEVREREGAGGWGYGFGSGMVGGGTGGGGRTLGGRDEPEEVKRQRLFVAARRREEAARREKEA